MNHLYCIHPTAIGAKSKGEWERLERQWAHGQIHGVLNLVSELLCHLLTVHPDQAAQPLPGSQSPMCKMGIVIPLSQWDMNPKAE